MVPVNGSTTTQCAIVAIAPSCITDVELFEVEEMVNVEETDLEVWDRAHSRSLELAPFDRSHTSSHWHSIVTMALSCIISEIKRDIGRRSHSKPSLGGSTSKCYHNNLVWKTRMVVLPESKKSLIIYLLVLIQYTNVTDGRTDRQSDRQIPHDTYVIAMHSVVRQTWPTPINQSINQSITIL